MSCPTSEKPGPYGRVAYEQEPGHPDVIRKNHNFQKEWSVVWQTNLDFFIAHGSPTLRRTPRACA